MQYHTTIIAYRLCVQPDGPHLVMQYSTHIHSPHTYEQFTLQLGLSHDADGIAKLVWFGINVQWNTQVSFFNLMCQQNWSK